MWLLKKKLFLFLWLEGLVVPIAMAFMHLGIIEQRSWWVLAPSASCKGFVVGHQKAIDLVN